MYFQTSRNNTTNAKSRKCLNVSEKSLMFYFQKPNAIIHLPLKNELEKKSWKFVYILAKKSRSPFNSTRFFLTKILKYFTHFCLPLNRYQWWWWCNRWHNRWLSSICQGILISFIFFFSWKSKCSRSISLLSVLPRIAGGFVSCL